MGVLCVKASLWWGACPTVASFRRHCLPPIAPNGPCGQRLSTQWWPMKGWCWKGVSQERSTRTRGIFQGKGGEEACAAEAFWISWSCGMWEAQRVTDLDRGEEMAWRAWQAWVQGSVCPPLHWAVVMDVVCFSHWRQSQSCLALLLCRAGSCDAHATWVEVLRFADSWSFVSSHQHEPNS